MPLIWVSPSENQEEKLAKSNNSCFFSGTLKNLRLGMYHQNSCMFYNRISYDRDYSGLSHDEEEGMRTARQLGDKSVLFMCNHGVLVVAPTAARAVDDTYYLERACMTQVRIIPAIRKSDGLYCVWVFFPNISYAQKASRMQINSYPVGRYYRYSPRLNPLESNLLSSQNHINSD